MIVDLWRSVMCSHVGVPAARKNCKMVSCIKLTISSAYDAPWYFAAALHQQAVEGVTYSTPGFMDSKHDVTLAMLDWVEKGIAPAEIIATGYKDNDARKGVEKQRPLCPYPQVATYGGKGHIDDAKSWSCFSPVTQII